MSLHIILRIKGLWPSPWVASKFLSDHALCVWPCFEIAEKKVRTKKKLGGNNLETHTHIHSRANVCDLRLINWQQLERQTKLARTICGNDCIKGYIELTYRGVVLFVIRFTLIGCMLPWSFKWTQRGKHLNCSPLRKKTYVFYSHRTYLAAAILKLPLLRICYWAKKNFTVILEVEIFEGEIRDASDCLKPHQVFMDIFYCLL